MQHLTRKFSGYVFLYVVIASLITTALLNLWIYFGFGPESTRENAALIPLMLRLVIYLPPLCVIAFRNYPMRKILRLNPFPVTQFWFTIGISLCLYFFSSLFGKLIDNLSGMIFFPEFSPFYFSVNPSSLWPYLVTGCLIPALLVECVFRGAIQSGYHAVKPVKACLIVGILFALAHLNFEMFIPNTILGFVLGYISIRADSILPCIISSFLYSLFACIDLADRLYFFGLASLGLGENITAVVFANLFILVGGFLMIKMPEKKCVSGSFKWASLLQALRKLRKPIEPLDGAQDQTPPEGPVDTTGAIAAEISLPEKPYASMAIPTVQQEETADIDIVGETYGNMPIIVGIYITATATVLIYGLLIFANLGYL